MSNESTKNMNFFSRIITSIKDFDKYQIFALEKISTAIRIFSTNYGDFFGIGSRYFYL